MFNREVGQKGQSVTGEEQQQEEEYFDQSLSRSLMKMTIRTHAPSILGPVCFF